MMAEANNHISLMQSDWRPVFWEPVAGTGERLMAGVVIKRGDDWHAARIIRDDVLDSLYGSGSSGAKALIDQGLKGALLIAQSAGLQSLTSPILGLSPGDLRRTSAFSFAEVIRHAALLYGSLTNIDAVDDDETDSATRRDEGGRRFGAEVRESVAAIRPDLRAWLNRKAALVSGGDLVRFGFYSANAIAHFSVIHPVRQTASLSAARGKLWELENARNLNGSNRAGLITAVPRIDDALMGRNQRDSLKRVKEELNREASKAGIEICEVTTVADGALQLISLHDQ